MVLREWRMDNSAPGGAAQAKLIANWKLAVFSLPAMISAIILGPLAGVLPTIYATRFGLDLIAIGSIFLVVRIFDAVIDPAIGLFSDKTKSPIGSRKPWIAAGMAVATVAMLFLFMPPDKVSITYLLVWMTVFYFGYSLLEIPYAAWSLELSRESKERTRINAFRAAALYAGGILFTLAPALVPAAQGKMDFPALAVIGIVLAVIGPLAVLATIALVPRGETATTEPPKLTELWGSVKGSKPFQAFVLMYAFIGIASGVSGVVGFMYISSYLQIGNRFTELFLPATVLGPLMIPVWAWLLRRFDKYKVTAIAFSLYACIMPLGWFVSPGPNSFLPMLLIFCGLSLFYPLLMISMPTILGDIIDLDELETGKNRAAQFSAFLVLVAKASAAVGGPLALLAIGAYGFNPAAATNSDSAILGLRLASNWLPVLLVLPGLFLLWRFPMSDARHAEIKAQLDLRRLATASAG
jgi:Na+/melibiose symporter-like transporter